VTSQERYAVRLLSADDAPAAARAWNDFADGTLAPETVTRLEAVLAASGSEDFAAFAAEKNGDLCGLATARVTESALYGRRGEIEALMIDGRLPDEAGAALAQHAIEWLRARGVASITHMRDRHAPGAFWERLGFRPDLLRYTLSG
jgi:GNAT superfamily N-acetyltransferase